MIESCLAGMIDFECIFIRICFCNKMERFSSEWND